MAKKHDHYADLPFNQQRTAKYKQEDIWVGKTLLPLIQERQI